jgi:TadE-like protein
MRLSRPKGPDLDVNLQKIYGPSARSASEFVCVEVKDMLLLKSNFAIAGARAAQRLRREESGATAVEFGFVIVPFFMLLFGVMAAGLFFFTSFSLENAVWAASRDLRTGVYQTNAAGSRYFGKTGDALKDEFKKAICERAAGFVNTGCANDVRILVASYSSATSASDSNLDSIPAPQCRDTANGKPNALRTETDTRAGFSAGSQGSVVLVTACYAYKLGGSFPFLKFGNMGNGRHLIQASAAFQSEPYATN